MGKLTISMAIFNSKLLVNTRLDIIIYLWLKGFWYTLFIHVGKYSIHGACGIDIIQSWSWKTLYEWTFFFGTSPINRPFSSQPCLITRGYIPSNPIQPPFSYGFPMVFLWFSYGFPMVHPHHRVE